MFHSPHVETKDSKVVRKAAAAADGKDAKGARGKDDDSEEEDALFNSSFDDAPVSDTESQEDYRRGGYHWVRIGDVYQDKYVVHRKLGWGQFSTVWLTTDVTRSPHDPNKVMALKIIKSAPQYREAAQEEINLLEIVAKAPDMPGRRYVVQMQNTFELHGPNGTHLCIAFELMGRTLLSYIRKKEEDVLCRNLKTVKRLTFQMALGLHYLHDICKIVHTDIKPENFLLSRRHPADAKSIEAATLSYIKSLKRTTRSWHDRRPSAESLKNLMATTSTVTSSDSHQFDVDYISRQYSNISERGDPDSQAVTSEDTKSEALLAQMKESATDTTNDGSPSFIVPAVPTRPPPLIKLSSTATHATVSSLAGTMTTETSRTNIDTDLLPVPMSRQTSSSTIDHEEAEVKICDLGNACNLGCLATSIISTRQYRSPEVILGLPWGTKTDVWSLGCVIFELLTGDYCFDPQAERANNLTRDEHHLQLMMELLGAIPQSLISEGKRSKKFFDSKGKLRHTKVYGHWGLELLLDRRYGMSQHDARETAKALEGMMKFDENERWSAGQLLRSEWLSEEAKRSGIDFDKDKTYL
mmetsp:Transcript_2610/g.5979  ORF Transcript_2610/g.5979 Transcript_2610/m.5979 type:complete len:582 (-) Transcript_2610:466-2211(-)